jgi:hypothetical protein
VEEITCHKADLHYHTGTKNTKRPFYTVKQATCITSFMPMEAVVDDALEFDSNNC